MKTSKAIEAINRNGSLLVFPIQNREEPKSLWSELYPKTKMKWEWDDSADSRVAKLWHLREELSRSKRVVYSKWYQGRATFFSREVFTYLTTLLGHTKGLTRESLSVLQMLEEESPLSTKALKKKCRLQGQAMEGTYQKLLKPLWTRGFIVGFGEVDEGAFPSLAIGATSLLFEDLWSEGQKFTSSEAFKRLENLLKTSPLVWKEVQKQLKLLNEIKLPVRKKKWVRGKDLYLD
ncbi:MAG: hypothetical protein ACKOA8_06205 [Deltaproteobacteria bacterium]|jgi:hypothetical protein